MTEALQLEIRTLRTLLDSERDPAGRAFAPLADAYRRAGQVSEALRILREGIAKHPDFVTGHVVAAQLYVEQGLATEGAMAARRALALDGENVSALKSLLRALDESGEAEEAEGVRSLLTTLEPDFQPDWAVATPDVGADVAAADEGAPADTMEAALAPTLEIHALESESSVAAGLEDMESASEASSAMSADAMIDLSTIVPLPAADLPLSMLSVPSSELPPDAPTVPESTIDLELVDLVPSARFERVEPALDDEPVMDLAALAPDASDDEPVMDLAALAPDASDDEPVMDLATLAPDASDDELVMDLASLAPDASDDELVMDLAALAPDASDDEPVFELAMLAPSAPEGAPTGELEEAGAAAPVDPLEARMLSAKSTSPPATMVPEEEPVFELEALASAHEGPSASGITTEATAHDPSTENGRMADEEAREVGLVSSDVQQEAVDLDALEQLATATSPGQPAAGALEVESASVSDQPEGAEPQALSATLPSQGQPADVEADFAADDQGEPIPTRTLAELYAQQGAVKEAVAVLRHLLAGNLDDVELAARIEELEGGWTPPRAPRADDPAAVVQEGEGEDEEVEALARELAESGRSPHAHTEGDSPFSWGDRASPGSTGAEGQTIREYFDGLLQWEPRKR